MKGTLHVHYDEEADFLELHIGDYTRGYFRDVGDGIAQRIDEKTGKVTGIAILSFKTRTENAKDFTIPLPIQLELSV